MKTIKHTTILFLACAATLLGSCKADPWDDVSEGGWNHERTILDIQLEGQAGVAEIENTDATTGVITLKIASDLVEDMAAVKITKLSLSYQAESSVKQGETLDFSGSSIPSITITSQLGETRTYAMNMTPFREDLVGIYAINDLKVFGGTGPNYGGSAVMSVMDKSWLWTSGSTKPKAECDNYLVFTLGAILDNGNTSGECINYAGEDGNYWDCIYLAKYNKLGTGDLNLEPFYRRIPKGHSTWVRDYTAGTITFTAEDGTTSTSTLMESGTYTLYDDGSYTKTLSVPNQAFSFTCTGKDDWTNIYGDFDKFVSNPRKFFVLVTKQADDFVLPEEAKKL